MIKFIDLLFHICCLGINSSFAIDLEENGLRASKLRKISDAEQDASTLQPSEPELPPEIWTHISGYLIDDLSSLATLTLTSKSMREVANTTAEPFNKRYSYVSWKKSHYSKTLADSAIYLQNRVIDQLLNLFYKGEQPYFCPQQKRKFKGSYQKLLKHLPHNGVKRVIFSKALELWNGQFEQSQEMPLLDIFHDLLIEANSTPVNNVKAGELASFYASLYWPILSSENLPVGVLNLLKAVVDAGIKTPYSYANGFVRFLSQVGSWIEPAGQMKMVKQACFDTCQKDNPVFLDHLLVQITKKEMQHPFAIMFFDIFLSCTLSDNQIDEKVKRRIHPFKQLLHIWLSRNISDDQPYKIAVASQVIIKRFPEAGVYLFDPLKEFYHDNFPSLMFHLNYKRLKYLSHIDSQLAPKIFKAVVDDCDDLSHKFDDYHLKEVLEGLRTKFNALAMQADNGVLTADSLQEGLKSLKDAFKLFDREHIKQEVKQENISLT